jgi:hypothetical protein
MLVAFASSRAAISCSRQRASILDFVERALARRGDPGDVVPDVPVLELQRIALDPDVCGESRGEKTLRVG